MCVRISAVFGGEYCFLTFCGFRLCESRENPRIRLGHVLEAWVYGSLEVWTVVLAQPIFAEIIHLFE